MREDGTGTHRKFKKKQKQNILDKTNRLWKVLFSKDIWDPVAINHQYPFLCRHSWSVRCVLCVSVCTRLMFISVGASISTITVNSRLSWCWQTFTELLSSKRSTVTAHSVKWFQLIDQLSGLRLDSYTSEILFSISELLIGHMGRQCLPRSRRVPLSRLGKYLVISKWS